MFCHSGVKTHLFQIFCFSPRPVISFTATRAVVRQMLVYLGLGLKAENTHLVCVSCCSTMLRVSTHPPQLTCWPVPDPPDPPRSPGMQKRDNRGTAAVQAEGRLWLWLPLWQKKNGCNVWFVCFLRSIWCFKNFPHSHETHSNCLFPAACSRLLNKVPTAVWR